MLYFIAFGMCISSRSTTPGAVEYVVENQEWNVKMGLTKAESNRQQ